MAANYAPSQRLYNAIVIVASIALLLPFPAENLWWREFFNSGHTVIFIVVSVVIHFQLTSKVPALNKRLVYLFTFIAGVMFGVAVEVVQGFVGREPSWADLYTDMLGLVVGLLLIPIYFQKRRCTFKKQFLFVVPACCLTLIGLFPLLVVSEHYIQRANAFPVILDFGATWTNSFVHFDNVEMDRGLGKKGTSSMFITQFSTGHYPGISVVEPESNWSAYSDLHFSVRSDDEDDLELVLRIHDKTHNNNYSDRFNQKLIIHPGLNEIKILLAKIEKGPIKREIDLSSIAGLTLFFSNLEKPQRLKLSNIYLQ